MEDYTGKTQEDLLEILEMLNEEQEMFEEDLDDRDYKIRYDKNAEKIIKINEALGEMNTDAPVEQDLDSSYNPAGEDSPPAEEFEETQEEIETKPIEIKKVSEENLDSIKFSDIKVDNSLFFSKGGAIYEGDKVKIKDSGTTMKVTDISKNKKDQVEFTGKNGSYLIGDIEKMAKGGEVIFTDLKDNTSSRKIWENKKSSNGQKSFGAFAHKIDKKYIGDYYLYKLDDYDEKFYSHIPLKDGEILARIQTDNMVGGEMPLVKINITNGRVYFMSDDNDRNSDYDDKNPKFNRASANVVFLSLDNAIKDYESKKMEKGGSLNENKEYIIRVYDNEEDYDFDENYEVVHLDDEAPNEKRAISKARYIEDSNTWVRVVDNASQYNDEIYSSKFPRGFAEGGFVKDNYWGIDKEEYDELIEEKQLDLGKWVLYYNEAMKEWEATMDGNYTHTFKSLNDLMERKNEIDVYEYDEELTEEKGEEVITNSKGEIREYAKGGSVKKELEGYQGMYDYAIANNFTPSQLADELEFSTGLKDERDKKFYAHLKNLTRMFPDKPLSEFSKGGALSSDTSDVYFFAYEEFMKNGKKFKSEKELYDFVNDGYAFPKYSKKSVKSAFESLNKSEYAKGGSVRRTNNSPLLRYTNFEDGWIFNLVKLNPFRNQDGLKYKENYKYGISRQGPGKNQEVWQYATLEEANKKYDELIELGKTYSKIKTKGNISKNYAKGGTIDKNLTYKGEVVGFKGDDTGGAVFLGDIDIPKNSTPKSIIELAKSKFKRTWYVEVSKDGEYLYEIADDSYKGEYPMVTAYAKGGELNKGDVVRQTGKFAESGDYYVVEKDKGNKDEEAENYYQLSEVRKKEQGWFEESDLEKLYAKGGEIPYSKEIYDQKNVLIKVGDRVKGDWKSTKGSGRLYQNIDGVVIDSKNYPVPAVGIMLNNGDKDYLQPEYDYSQGKFVLKGRTNDMNIGVDVVDSTYAKGGEIKNGVYEYIELKGTRFEKNRGYTIRDDKWNDLIKKGVLPSKDINLAEDWRTAIKEEAWGKYTREMYSPKLDRLREQTANEFYNNKVYAKGGETDSPITNYKKNIMGTTSFDLKVKGMRKPQDFIVYPITEKTDKIRIQSGKKFGEIHLPTGKGILSKSGNTSWHLSSDMMNRNVNTFELSEAELQEFINQIKSTSGKSVGSSFVKSDNSGARLLEDGGKLDMNEIDIYQGMDGDYTIVMHGDVYDMNHHTMPNMSIDMYAGNRAEYPADISHWGKKITYEKAPIVIKNKIEKRAEEYNKQFAKGGEVSDKRQRVAEFKVMMDYDNGFYDEELDREYGSVTPEEAIEWELKNRVKTDEDADYYLDEDGDLVMEKGGKVDLKKFDKEIEEQIGILESMIKEEKDDGLRKELMEEIEKMKKVL